MTIRDRFYDDRYKEFRAKVLARDKRCKFPGCKRTKYLQIHHIVRWSDSPALRYSVENGIALCPKCHKKVKGKEHLYAELFIDIIRYKK